MKNNRVFRLIVAVLVAYASLALEVQAVDTNAAPTGGGWNEEQLNSRDPPP
jgi:hypothetical protein